MTLTADNTEQVKAWVIRGDRPPLDSVEGNADLMSFAERWISQCWHNSPEERPIFDGKHSNAEIYSTAT